MGLFGRRHQDSKRVILSNTDEYADGASANCLASPSKQVGPCRKCGQTMYGRVQTAADGSTYFQHTRRCPPKIRSGRCVDCQGLVMYPPQRDADGNEFWRHPSGCPRRYRRG